MARPMTILRMLDDESIFSIEPAGAGRFIIMEACDHYFECTLTADQVRELARELLALADAAETPEGV